MQIFTAGLLCPKTVCFYFELHSYGLLSLFAVGFCSVRQFSRVGFNFRSSTGGQPIYIRGRGGGGENRTNKKDVGTRRNI